MGQCPVASKGAATRSSSTEPEFNSAIGAARVLPAGSPGSSVGMDNDVTTEVILYLVVLDASLSGNKK